MSAMNDHSEHPNGAGVYFDEETWRQLPELLAHLPRPVTLHLWGDAKGSPAEAETVNLLATLSRHFDTVSYQLFPRRANYPYYPVIGVMDGQGAEVVDHGLRLIGRPAGYQLTSLIAAIQCVAFQGQTAETRSRILLSRLASEVTLELITTGHDEAGTVMAQDIFNLAVNSKYVRSFLIMADQFPEAAVRFSVEMVPHLIINGRVHVSGPVDEENLLQQIARAVNPATG
jgi:alkyl hydroperoxide reductase subunit AhpF